MPISLPISRLPNHTAQHNIPNFYHNKGYKDNDWVMELGKLFTQQIDQGKFYPIVGLVIPNAYLPSAGCPLCRHLSFDTCWVNAYSKKLGKSWPTYTQFSFTQWSLPNISKSVLQFLLHFGLRFIWTYFQRLICISDHRIM